MKHVLLAMALVSALACAETQQADILSQDSTLARDLALANLDTASQPQLADEPTFTNPPPIEFEPAPPPRVQAAAKKTVARAPVPAPAPAPPPAEPVTRTTESGNTEVTDTRGTEPQLGIISAGSQISLAARERICTNTNQVGDRFTAQISNAVMGANGTVIPVGATARVVISSLHRSGGAGESIEMGLTVESITFDGRTYAVNSETTYAEVDRVRVQSRTDDARKVAAGAAIGAVIGQILGGKTKSTVVGAATGAAAGAVVANRSADYDGCIPSGGQITIRLSEPLTVQRVT